MLPQTAEIPKDLQETLVRHLFFKPEFSFYDADTTARLDPDLSMTIGLLVQGSVPYYTRLLDVGLAKMSSDIHGERDPNIPKKRTDQDLGALQHIDVVLNTSHSMSFTDRERAEIDAQALQLFGYTTARRPDLTARAEFPWNTAVNLTVSVPANPWIRRFNERVNILINAPEALVQKAMAEHANNGINILDTLYDEKPFGESGMPDSPQLWEVIRRAPDGNLPLAQSTVLWALRVQSLTMYREQEQYGTPISPDTLHQTWQLIQEKWDALSSDDRGKFLNMDVLFLTQSIYQYSREYGITPPSQMDQIVQTIIQTTSDAGKEELEKDLIAYVEEHPKEKLDMIAKWFPSIAEAVEAQRPKTLFQKAATLFRRS